MVELVLDLAGSMDDTLEGQGGDCPMFYLIVKLIKKLRSRRR